MVLTKSAGLFNLNHLIFTLTSFLLIFLVVNFFKNKSPEFKRISFQILSISLIILEVIKIIWNIFFREGVKVEDYLPLYFCSLFLFFFFFESFKLFKNEKIEKFIKEFLIYGGFTGGVSFLLFPTSSLLIFPLYHFLTIHSLIYHVLMVSVSLILLKDFDLAISDFKSYALGLGLIEGLILIINFSFQKNFMFLNQPFGLKIFELIYDYTKPIYPFLMAIGQILLTFFCGFLILKLCKRYFFKNPKI